MNDVAWAAGLFEGEGYFGLISRLKEGYKRPAARMSLGMTDEDVVQRFARIVGIGRVYSYQRRGRKRMWRWDAGGYHNAVYLLGLFHPYLGERRLAAATAVVDGCGKHADRVAYRMSSHA